jgi:hypothetical protein
VARWRAGPDERFPAPLREFREEDWPPLPGECLDLFSCLGSGYDAPCVPRPGESCGQLYREELARDGRPEVLAAARTADALNRFRRARLCWLGEDHPDYVTELVEGWQAEESARYAPFRTHDG